MIFASPVRIVKTATGAGEVKYQSEKRIPSTYCWGNLLKRITCYNQRREVVLRGGVLWG
jgi:hypothetical protein